jgi:hypothetical protein
VGVHRWEASDVIRWRPAPTFAHCAGLTVLLRFPLFPCKAGFRLCVYQMHSAAHRQFDWWAGKKLETGDSASTNTIFWALANRIWGAVLVGM